MKMENHNGNIDQYRFAMTRVADHILVSITPADPSVTVEGRLVAVYCISKKDDKALDHCLGHAKTLGSVLAFLECREFRPKMSKLERDILIYWRDRREQDRRRAENRR